MNMPEDRQAVLRPWVEMTRFWSELDSVSREDLWTDTEFLEFEQGDVIDVPFGLLVSGIAGVEYMTAPERRSIVELFRSADMVDMARYERQPQGVFRALGYCAMILLQAADFERCASHQADMLRAYRRQVEDQTGRLRDHFNDLAVKTPLERIVSVLFELRHWPDDDTQDIVTTVLPILRKDLAAYFGLRPETLSRVEKTLVKTGLISRAPGDKVIRLENVPALRLVANGKGQDVLEEGA